MIVWAAIHTSIWCLLYMAFALDVDGALSGIKFLAWVLGIASLALLHREAVRVRAKQPETPFRAVASRFQAAVMLGLLVWFGHIVTACALLVFIANMHISSGEVKALRSKPTGM